MADNWFSLNLIGIILLFGAINLANVKSSMNLIAVPLLAIWASLNHQYLLWCGFTLIYQFWVGILYWKKNGFLQFWKMYNQHSFKFCLFSTFLISHSKIPADVFPRLLILFSIFLTYFSFFFFFISLLWANFHFLIVLDWLSCWRI